MARGWQPWILESVGRTARGWQPWILESVRWTAQGWRTGTLEDLGRMANRRQMARHLQRTGRRPMAGLLQRTKGEGTGETATVVSSMRSRQGARTGEILEAASSSKQPLLESRAKMGSSSVNPLGAGTKVEDVSSSPYQVTGTGEVAASMSPR